MKTLIAVMLLLNFIVYIPAIMLSDLKILQLEGYCWHKVLSYNLRYNKKRFLFHCIPIIYLIVLGVKLDISSNILNVIFLSLVFMFLIVFTISKIVKDSYPIFTKRIFRTLMVYVLLFASFVVLTIFYIAMTKIWIMMTILCEILSICSIFIINIIEYILSKINAISACKKLEKSKVIKIAITGSYGKTSVKHILKTILSEKFSVLMSPKSFNTINGFSLTINKNNLKDYDVVIMEMGAKKKGDIRELCKYFQPEYGILTSIGKQHLESFKSINNIILAKAELQEYIKNKGLMIFNCDCEYVNNQYIAFNGKKISVGINDGYVSAKNIKLSATGSWFDIYINNCYLVAVETILIGEHNIINILMAVAMAYSLGLSEMQIKRGVFKIKEIESRMERHVLPSGAIVINNGYNSNPNSAKASLKLLEMYKDKNKIIITPGFVEMGTEQYRLNYLFAEDILKVCDDCYVVNKINRKAFGDAFNSIGFNKFHIVDRFKDIDFSIFGSNDVILIENDLPDNYV